MYEQLSFLPAPPDKRPHEDVENQIASIAANSLTREAFKFTNNSEEYIPERDTTSYKPVSEEELWSKLHETAEAACIKGEEKAEQERRDRFAKTRGDSSVQ